MSISRMLKLVTWKEDDQYVAWCINNGVSSFGKTRKEALESLEEALQLYFEDVPLENITKVEHPVIESLSFRNA